MPDTWTARDARRFFAMVFEAPDELGYSNPEDPDVVAAVCDWTDAVIEADAAGRLDELLRMRDVLGAAPAARWWSGERGE